VQDCTVLLHGPLQALHLYNLQGCHVQAGPVSSATFGENLQGCTLHLATHQLRLHHVNNTRVYVLPGSNPIIEHCSGIGFAPMQTLPYEGFAAAVKLAGLPERCQDSAWDRVQDFQYPGHMSSHNWYIMEGSEPEGALAHA
jgi:tubulin-specific chaperone C